MDVFKLMIRGHFILILTTDEELAPKIGVCLNDAGTSDYRIPVLFCLGHTHRPLIRSLNGILVVNAGSAGLSFDGDHRAAYAQLTYRHGDWQAKIIRLKYDLRASEQDFYDTGYPSHRPAAASST